MPDAAPSDVDRRRALLTAALGFLQVDQTKVSHTGLTALHTWLDSWRGIGDVGAGPTGTRPGLRLRHAP